MKKILLTACVAIFVHATCFAQVPSQADMDKLLKEAKDQLKSMGGDSLASSKLKELEKNEKQFKSIVTNSKTNVDANQKPGAFPVRQVKLLALVSRKRLSRQEAAAFITQLNKTLKGKLATQYVQSAERIIAKLNDPFLIMEAAVLAAHSNAGEEAILLATYAASVKPEPNLVNNCAAILTMGGLEPASITLLKTLLPAYSNNTTVLNNMGQAYAALGEKDSAMLFLGRCIKLNPNHAQARHCAGVIENSKGNKKAATDHLQKSLENAYDPDASRLVKFIDPSSKLSRFAKPHIKIPEYFNIHKYLPFPEPAVSVDDLPRAEGERKEYVAMLQREIDKLSKMMTEAASGSNTILSSVSNNFTTGFAVPKESMMRTAFYQFCSEMVNDLAIELKDNHQTFSDQKKNIQIELKTLEQLYYEDKKKIDKQYQMVHYASCRGEDGCKCPRPDEDEHCRKVNDLTNLHLKRSALHIKDMQLKLLHPYQNFNEIAYWDYLKYAPLHPKPSGILTFRNIFYSHAISYLRALQIHTWVVSAQPCKLQPPAAASRKEGGSIEEPECPFEISKEYGIFKFEMDCDKSTLTLSATDEINFIYSKDNFSKASSIEIEMGIEHKDKWEIIPGYTSSLGGGINESLVIEFDKEGKFSDFQIKGGVKVSASATIDPKNEAVKKVVNTTAWKGSEKFNYTFSMKNGFSYEDGLLRPVAESILGIKPEVQINKNVQPFKN
ncbi:MAG: hypothetical protein H7Y42_06085 [Chitinophagaceae bacterium]|nr:hypothetical protein [Chitinophagaceae bacterium]